MATRIRREGTRGGVLRTSPIYGVLGNEKKQDHPVATDYGHPQESTADVLVSGSVGR
jgi:hypothetical protein